MLHSTILLGPVRRCFLPLGSAVLLALLAATAHAQMGGVDSDPGDRGTGGNNTIQGRVYLPSGNLLDRRIRVRLSSVRGGEMMTMTDDNGAFSFRRLDGGNYLLTVEAGKEFEPARETVDIMESARVRGSNQPGRTYTVQIQLQPNRGGAQQAPPGVLNAALAGVPKAALDLYQKALKDAGGGDAKKAVGRLKEAVTLHPGFMLAHNELGVQQMRLGQLDEAAESLGAALKLAPDAFAPRLNRGILLVLRKQFGEAESELRRAIEKGSGSALAHLYLGRTLISLGKFPEAERELARAVELGGEDSHQAHRYLGALYVEQGDNARAVAALETYLRLVPKARDAEQIRDIIKKLR